MPLTYEDEALGARNKYFKGIISGGKIISNLTQEEAEALEREEKKEQLKRDSQAAIDNAKQQIQQRRTGTPAQSMPQQGQMPQQQKPNVSIMDSNMEPVDQGGTPLLNQLSSYQTPQAKPQPQISEDDIYSQNQLTDKYSEVPEVQNYLKSERGRGFSRNVKGVSDNLASGGYEQDGEVNVSKLAGDFTSAIADYMPEEAVKNIQDVINKEMKKSSGSGAYSSRLLDMATPEDVAKANTIIDAMEQAGTYMDTPEQLAADRGFAETNPKLFMQELSKRMRGTSEWLRSKKEAIPINEKNAGATKAASNLAPDKLSDKNTDELTGQQNIYANLQDVGKRFNAKYITPYIGKNIKMAYLKQNDEDFPAFTSSLGLAMNEYRRQNFGTAQTNAEIQNFLDVLNSDLNIKPEAFQKQLNTVMNAMKRDFNNRVKTKEQQNYVIPESLENIDQGTGDTETKGPTVKVGDVVNGYRFKGGDPNNKNSWEKAK